MSRGAIGRVVTRRARQTRQHAVVMCLLFWNHIVYRRLHALLNQVVAEPLHHQVALPGSHRFVVDANDECLPSLLHRDPARSLRNKNKKFVMHSYYWTERYAQSCTIQHLRVT